MDQGHHSWYPATLLLKVDKLLLEHVGLPHVLDLSVHWSFFVALRSIEIDNKHSREAVRAMLGTNVRDFVLLPGIVSCSS